MNPKTLIPLVILLVIPWIIFFFVYMNAKKKIIKNYKKLEEKYGLSCDYSKKVGMTAHPSAQGLYRSRNIKIESIIRDTIEGKKVMPHTALSVECVNSDNFSFMVVKRKKRSSFLAGSSLIDDNEFDDKFIIQTSNPQKMKSIFDFNTRFKLDQVHALGFDGAIILKGNSLMYIEKNLLKNDEALMRMELVMHELCDIADVMRYN